MERPLLNQARRLELCRRMLGKDRTQASNAHVDLASLYDEAGYHTLALSLLGTTLSQAKEHARMIVEGRVHS